MPSSERASMTWDVDGKTSSAGRRGMEDVGAQDDSIATADASAEPPAGDEVITALPMHVSSH